MKKVNKLIVTLLIAVLCVSVILVPAMAASVTDSNLEVTLTTDKDVYTQDEQITATLVVKNIGDKTLENVSLATSLPEGFSLSADSANSTQIAELKAGESTTLTVIYTCDKPAETGDHSGIVIAIALMVVAVMGLVAVMTRSKAMLSLVLCIALVGAVCMPAQAAALELTVDATFKVADSDVTITGTVSYEEAEEVLPEDIQVTNGGFETGDLTGWTTLTEGWGEADGKPTGVISAATYWGENLPYNQSGEYHLDGWKIQETSVDGVINEAAAWGVRSEEFTLAGSGFITAKMGGNAAAIKVYLADGTLIGYYKQTRFNDANFPNVGPGNGSWADMGTYVMDLSEYVGQKLYIELWDEGAGAWAVAFFDEVVTYYETAPDYANMYDTVAQSVTGEEVHLPWTLAVNVK